MAILSRRTAKRESDRGGLPPPRVRETEPRQWVDGSPG